MKILSESSTTKADFNFFQSRFRHPNNVHNRVKIREKLWNFVKAKMLEVMYWCGIGSSGRNLGRSLQWIRSPSLCPAELPRQEAENLKVGGVYYIGIGLKVPTYALIKGFTNSNSHVKFRPQHKDIVRACGGNLQGSFYMELTLNLWEVNLITWRLL